MIRPSPARRAAGIVLLAGAGALLGRAGYWLAGLPGPSVGLGAGAMLFFGRGLWPGIALAQFLLVWDRGYPLPAAAAAALLAAGAALLCRRCLLRKAGGRRALESVHGVYWLLGCCAGAAALQSVGEALIAAAAGRAAWAGLHWSLLNRWFAHAVSSWLILPALLAWAAEPHEPRAPRAERWTWLAATTAASFLLFGAVPLERPLPPLTLLPLVCLLWAAFRLGARACSVGLLLTAACALAGARLELGPFARYGPAESMLMVESLLGFCALIAHTAAAANAERERLLAAGRSELSAVTKFLARETARRVGLDRELRRREESLRRLADSDILGIFFVDGEGLIGDANDAFLRLTGYAREDLPLREDRMTPPEWLPALKRARGELAASGAAAPVERELFRKDGARVPVLVGAVGLGAREGAPAQIAFVVDLSERQRARQVDALIETQQRQKHFLAQLSHELRTPIAALRGFSQTLLLGAMDDPKTRTRFVTAIDRHARRLSLMIDQLLSLAALERPEFRSDAAQPEFVFLRELVGECVEGMLPLAEERKVDIVYRVPKELCVPGHRLHLMMMLTNLVDNAIKFNHNGGRILVTARRLGARAELAVRDSGGGIAPERMPQIFERFNRHGRKGGPLGMGIGLHLVQELTRAHRGEVRIVSREGAGTTVRLLLPACSAAPAQARRV